LLPRKRWFLILLALLILVLYFFIQTDPYNIKGQVSTSISYIVQQINTGSTEIGEQINKGLQTISAVFSGLNRTSQSQAIYSAGVVTAVIVGAASIGLAIKWRMKKIKKAPTLKVEKDQKIISPKPSKWSKTRSLGSSVLGPVVGSVARVRPVELGASVPRQVSPGSKFTARFVAYNKQLEKEVEKILRNLSSRSKFPLGVKRCRWKTGIKVKVKFSGDFLKVDKAEKEFLWEGKYEIVDFDVEVQPEARNKTIAKFDLFIDDFFITDLRVDLPISPEGFLSDRIGVRTILPQSAFASYASEDAPRVLDRVAALKSCGIDVFVDCLSINPSENWKLRLEKEILRRELFILFWSKNAKDSQWVTWEWQTALREKGLSAIQIQPLQSPFDAPPPQELRDLHFRSPDMSIRAEYEMHRSAEAA
jgi:hypothetical protein